MRLPDVPLGVEKDLYLFLLEMKKSIETLNFYKGTATIPEGQTSVLVDPNLPVATLSLDDIIVIPTNDLGSANKFWVTLSGKKFIIHVDLDPGPGGASFIWKVLK